MVSPPLKVLRALYVLAVVVLKAVERVTAPVEADAVSGYEALSEVTPVLVITPVEELYEMPVPPEREVLLILLLKVV